MRLIRLFYVSRPRPGIAAAEVHRIVGTSQVNNRRRGVTGLLVYDGQAFAQILEGQAEALEELMARIGADDRHGEIHLLQREADVNERRFGAWAMHLLESPSTADDLQTLLAQPVPDPGLVRSTLDRIHAEVDWHAG